MYNKSVPKFEGGNKLNCKIRIRHKKDTATIQIIASCAEGDYRQMYEAITIALKRCERMNITITNDEDTPCSIIKTLQFVSNQSAEKFLSRLHRV